MSKSLFNILLVSLFALSILLLTAELKAASQLERGGQIYTKQPFAYGKLSVEAQLSPEPGMVNGIFMYKIFQDFAHDGTYPNGWTEIDYEYVPANRMSGRRTAAGDCGSESGVNCQVSVLGNQTAKDFIAVNIIAGPVDRGPGPDSQVFYKVDQNTFTTGSNVYNIYFNPEQVLWGMNDASPFMYQTQNPAGFNTSNIHGSEFQYLKDRNMYIYLNFYSGQGGDWGGSGVFPDANRKPKMIVRKVEYHLLVPGSCIKDNKGQMNCQYETNPAMLSDFVNDKYFLNGQAVSRDDIWVNKDFNEGGISTFASNAEFIKGTGLVLNYRAQQNPNAVQVTVINAADVEIAEVQNNEQKQGIEVGPRISGHGSSNQVMVDPGKDLLILAPSQNWGLVCQVPANTLRAGMTVNTNVKWGSNCPVN